MRVDEETEEADFDLDTLGALDAPEASSTDFLLELISRDFAVKWRSEGLDNPRLKIFDLVKCVTVATDINRNTDTPHNINQCHNATTSQRHTTARKGFVSKDISKNKEVPKPIDDVIDAIFIKEMIKKI